MKLKFCKEGIATEALLEQFDLFLAEAHSLKAKYTDKIQLLVGLETEHITTGDLDHLEALLSRYPAKVQYLVGSVHHVNEIPIDFDLPTFKKALDSFTPQNQDDLSVDEASAQQTEAFLCAYFDAQYAVLARFFPEVVGHVDLCRLYNPALRFADYPQAHEKLKRNIKFAVEYGALFELNAAALRKGWTAAYPGEDVVEVIIKRHLRESCAKEDYPDSSFRLPAVDLHCRMIATARMQSV